RTAPPAPARSRPRARSGSRRPSTRSTTRRGCGSSDRKSTRLNSSHVAISYVVVCLKKKVKLPHFVGLEDAFILPPSHGEISRLTPITDTFPKAPAARTPDGQLQLLPSTHRRYAWLG